MFAYPHYLDKDTKQFIIHNLLGTIFYFEDIKRAFWCVRVGAFDPPPKKNTPPTARRGEVHYRDEIKSDSQSFLYY